jgi:hypothetical protein
MHEFNGTVHNGHLPAQTRLQIAEVCKRMEGKDLAISIKERKPTRTKPQNDRFKGYIVPLFQQFAYQQGTPLTHAQADQIVKEGIGWVEEVTLPDGTIKTLPKSTHDQPKDVMSDLIERATAWLITEWGIEVL